MNLPTGLIKTNEGVFVLKEDSHLSRWVEQHQRLDVADEEIMDRFAKYIPKGGIVVDAGACIGDHTATYAKLVGPGGMVYAFEPNPLAYQALARNFASARNVQTVPIALSDRAERAFVNHDINVGATFLTPQPDWDHAGVRCMKLDDVLLTISRLDFLHLDCEGYELKALMGAQRILHHMRPVIALEINTKCLDRLGIKQTEIFLFLINSGYRVIELEPGVDPLTCEQRDILALPNL